MSNAIGRMLPFAVAIDLSPLALVVGIIRVVAGLVDLAPSSTRDTIVASCKLVLGIVFLFLALRRVIVQRRSQTNQEMNMPRWMSGMNAFTLRQALLITVVVASLGNLPAILAGGLDIGRAKLTVGQSVVAVLLFVAIGSITVAGSVVYYLIRQEAAAARLQALKSWLSLHDQR